VAGMRPEPERKLRAGFQRRVDEQSNRHAAELAHAEQLADYFECGEVVGVYSARAGGDVRRRAYVRALLPMAAIPVLIAGAAARVPGMLPLLGVFPFAFGAWFGVSLWRGREPKRTVWFHAFTQGFILMDDPVAPAAPVRWNQVVDVSEVWTGVYNPASEESRPTLTAYRLRTADGQAHEISRSFWNVRDPYREVGQLIRGLVPASVGSTIPAFPTIDEIINAYTRRRGPGA
jgi:hypothetical protein